MDIEEINKISKDIHKKLGRNYDKHVYVSAFSKEMIKNDIQCDENVEFPISYLGFAIDKVTFDFKHNQTLINIIIINSKDEISYQLELFKNQIKNIKRTNDILDGVLIMFFTSNCNLDQTITRVVHIAVSDL